MVSHSSLRRDASRVAPCSRRRTDPPIPNTSRRRPPAGRIERHIVRPHSAASRARKAPRPRCSLSETSGEGLMGVSMRMGGAVAFARATADYRFRVWWRASREPRVRRPVSTRSESQRPRSAGARIDGRSRLNVTVCRDDCGSSRRGEGAIVPQPRLAGQGRPPARRRGRERAGPGSLASRRCLRRTRVED